MNSRLKSHYKRFFSTISHWYFMNTPCLLVKAIKTAIQSLCLVVFNPKKSPFLLLKIHGNPMFQVPFMAGCPVGFQFVQHVLDQIRGANQILTWRMWRSSVGFWWLRITPTKWDLNRQTWCFWWDWSKKSKKHLVNLWGFFLEPNWSCD